MSTEPKKNTSPVLEFKSSSLFVPVMVLYHNDLKQIEHSLQEKIKLAPEFFKNSPLIIDVQELNKQSTKINIEAITAMMRKIGLFPTGLRGGSDKQNAQAQALFIPIDTARQNETNTPPSIPAVQAVQTKPAEQHEEVDAKAVENEAVPVGPEHNAVQETKIVNQPIRSGQRLYAPGDLIILSPVSAGAEIIAEGNIHVYNTLRGRALAGVQGNNNARIFCSDLQAELISIAGDYKTNEDIDKAIHKKPVQIYLKNRALIIEEIGKTI